MGGRGTRFRGEGKRTQGALLFVSSIHLLPGPAQMSPPGAFPGPPPQAPTQARTLPPACLPLLGTPGTRTSIGLSMGSLAHWLSAPLYCEWQDGTPMTCLSAGCSTTVS